MKKTPTSSEQKVLLEKWDQYRGKIVLIVQDKIFATKRAAQVDKIVRKIEKEFHQRPLITYIPKEGTLVFPF